MAVDHKHPQRKVVPGRRLRHYGYQPTLGPMMILAEHATAEELERIREAIRSIRRKRTCGCYLFISPTREVHVLSEESSIATDWVLTRTAWLVALYHPKRVRLRTPGGLDLGDCDFDLEGLEEDVAEHLHGLAPASSAQVPGGK